MSLVDLLNDVEDEIVLAINEPDYHKKTSRLENARFALNDIINSCEGKGEDLIESQAYYSRGAVNFFNKQYDDAIGDLKIAIKVFDGLIESDFEQSHSLKELGIEPTGISASNVKVGYRTSLNSMLEKAYMEAIRERIQHDLEDADRLAKESIEVVGGQRLYYVAGEVKMLQKNYSEAIRLTSKAIEIEKESQNDVYNLCIYYMQLAGCYYIIDDNNNFRNTAEKIIEISAPYIRSKEIAKKTKLSLRGVIICHLKSRYYLNKLSTVGSIRKKTTEEHCNAVLDLMDSEKFNRLFHGLDKDMLMPIYNDAKKKLRDLNFFKYAPLLLLRSIKAAYKEKKT